MKLWVGSFQVLILIKLIRTLEELVGANHVNFQVIIGFPLDSASRFSLFPLSAKPSYWFNRVTNQLFLLSTKSFLWFNRVMVYLIFGHLLVKIINSRALPRVFILQQILQALCLIQFIPDGS
jgi:hypothetical protein